MQLPILILASEPIMSDIITTYFSYSDLKDKHKINARKFNIFLRTLTIRAVGLLLYSTPLSPQSDFMAMCLTCSQQKRTRSSSQEPIRPIFLL